MGVMEPDVTSSSSSLPAVHNTSHHTPTKRPATSTNSNGNNPGVKSSSAHTKPAAVLDSIIDSLDVLAPLPDIHDPHPTFDTPSRHSLPDSSSIASLRRASTTATTPGFGVEYRTGLELDDVDGVTDAALPPTIPTSRPPSGLSNYKAPTPRSAKKNFSSASSLRGRPNSRQSSFSTTSVTSSRNKLSSESWVRKTSVASGDDRSSIRGRTPRQTWLRRTRSQDTAIAGAGRSSVDAPSIKENAPTLSLAEQIIAKTPTQLSASKGRLYLTDATINEDPQSHSPPSPTPSPALLQTPSIGEPIAGVEGKSVSDKRLSSMSGRSSMNSSNMIQDSIPMRTSSLRQPGPAEKKKHKKSKRSAKASGATHKVPKSIPDSSWADLDEDDETVKRIKQLREQRKSRLQESTVPFLLPAEDATEIEAASNAQRASVPGPFPPSKDDTKPSVKSQKLNRHTFDSTKAHRTLGLKGERKQSSDLNGTPPPMNDTSGLKKPSNHSLDVKGPLSGLRRPMSAQSETQKLSLDYSYAEAVDVLHGIDHKKRAKVADRVEESTRSAAVAPPGLASLDLHTPENQVSIAIPQHSKSSKKAKRMSESRWVAHHPDLPIAFEKKKNRRKSMSDARLMKAAEDEMESRRRDSIEEAVGEYLNAPRLNQKVKHAQTGRVIAYSEVGDPKGAAVFICVGMGLTRYVTAFYDELALTLRLRLITLDRPGVGGSAPYPSADKSGPLNWPEDVLTICQHLGIVKFSILAHSAGAVYALATALILPHLVRGKVHLLAPWVPPSQLEAISHTAASAPPANPLPRSQRILRVLPTPFLRAANSSFMTATSTSLKPATKRNVKANTPRPSPRRTAAGADDERTSSRDRPEYKRRESMMLMDQYMPATNPMDNFPMTVSEGDGEDQEDGVAKTRKESLVLSATATPMDPSFSFASTGLNAAEHTEKERQALYTTLLTHATWDLATRDSNPATDLVVCLERNRDVGFRYTDVGCEVVITHGSEDKRVPIANVKWLAEQMNRRALELNPDGVDGRESKESWAENGGAGKGGCEVRVLPGEGHGLMASPTIMGDVLTEIAGYWLGQDKGRP